MKKTRKEQLRDIRLRKENPLLRTTPDPVIIVDSLPAHVGVDLAASYDSEARVNVVAAARRGRWSHGLANVFGSLRAATVSTEEASTALARFQDLYATLNPNVRPWRGLPRQLPPARQPRPQHLIAAFHALGYNVNNHADAHVLTPQQLQRGLRVLRLPVPGNLARPDADLAPSVRALCDGLGIPCVANPNRQRITPTITDYVHQPRMSEETVEADLSSLEDRVTATLAAEISRQVDRDIARTFGVADYEPEVLPTLTAEMLQSIAGSIAFESSAGVEPSVHDSYVHSNPRRMPDVTWRPSLTPTPAEEFVPRTVTPRKRANTTPVDKVLWTGGLLVVHYQLRFHDDSIYNKSEIYTVEQFEELFDADKGTLKSRQSSVTFDLSGCELPVWREPDSRAFRKAGRRNLRLRAYDKPTGEGD